MRSTRLNSQVMAAFQMTLFSLIALCSSGPALAATCFGIADTDVAVCSGWGVCVAEDTCVCGTGYFGAECELTSCYGINSDDPAVCSGNGDCVALNTCACEVGYEGDECLPIATNVPSASAWKLAVLVALIGGTGVLMYRRVGLAS